MKKFKKKLRYSTFSHNNTITCISMHPTIFRFAIERVVNSFRLANKPSYVNRIFYFHQIKIATSIRIYFYE